MGCHVQHGHVMVAMSSSELLLRADKETSTSILKRLAADVESLRSDNHVLPMLEEFAFQDIVFGIFPRIAVSLDRSVCSWPKNSVEDVVDMLMQALEVRMNV